MSEGAGLVLSKSFSLYYILLNLHNQNRFKIPGLEVLLWKHRTFEPGFFDVIEYYFVMCWWYKNFRLGISGLNFRVNIKDSIGGILILFDS